MSGMQMSQARSLAIFAAIATSLACCEKNPSSENSTPPNAAPSTSTISNALTPLERWNLLKHENPEGLVLTPERRAEINANKNDYIPEAKRNLSGKDDLTFSVLNSLININSLYISRMLELKEPALVVLRGRVVANQYLVRVVEDDVAALLEDENYRARLKATFGDKELDCKDVSTTLLLCMLLRFEQSNLKEPKVELRFVSGLAFDPRYTPDGIGHSWVEFNGQVWDCSIKTEDNHMTVVPISSKFYVPIVWAKLTYLRQTQKAEAEERIIRLPSH